MSAGPAASPRNKGWVELQDTYPETMRLQVPGGWLYLVKQMYQQPVMTFVPYIHMER